jgi:hypothetical protein
VRFTPPDQEGFGGGQLDDTYGAGGVFLDDDNPDQSNYVIQGCKRMSDGRLVIAASYTDAGTTVLQSLWRLASDGTFSNDVRTLDAAGFEQESGLALAEGPGDTAVIVGRLDDTAGFLRIDNSTNMFVGTWTSVVLDPSQGAVSILSDAVVSPDGSFVAVGGSLLLDVETPRAVRIGANDAIAGQVVAFDAGSGAQGPYRVARDDDGRFVVVRGTASERPSLVRLAPNLGLDPTWGFDGLSSSIALDEAVDILIDPAGRVVVAGHAAYDSDFDGNPDVSAMRVERFVSGP